MLTNPVRRSSVLITAAILITTGAAFAQTTWYVDVTACPDTGTGGETDPFCKIQDGILAASGGDNVLVLPGTYNEAIDLLGKLLTLRGRDGAEATTIDATGLNTTVVTCAGGQGAETVFRGFTVTGGVARYDEHGDRGGGMRNIGSSPTIAECVFRDNEAGLGGGMYNYEAQPTVTDCLFENNRFSGGGMLNFSSSPTIERCTFRGNEASHEGGAMLNRDGSAPTITECLFEQNTAYYSGGAIFDAGAGAIITDCLFRGNIAREGGAINIGWLADPELRGCTFIENRTSRYGIGGGAIHANRNTVTLSDCTFLGNSTYKEGGAIRASGARLAIANGIFVGNSAARGGAIHQSADFSRLINCTLIANRGAEGGAAYFGAGGTIASFSNSIFWDNGPRWMTYHDIGSSSLVAGSNIEGGVPPYADDLGGNIEARPLLARHPDDGGDGWGDDPDTPDVDEGANDDYGDLRLRSGSPGIDAGRNDLVPEGVTTDAGGQPRFVDEVCATDTGGGVAPIVDMGAFEFQPVDSCGDGLCDPEESCASCTCDCGDCCGDLTCDVFENCNTCAEDCTCRVLHVPGDYPTIQDAIDAAIDADEIVVAPGTYVENIDFLGKEIIVRSSEGPEVTTLEPRDWQLSVVTITAGEGPYATLGGFTVRDGTGSDCPDGSGGQCGGGVLVADSSPTIEACEFQLNYGSAIFALRSRLTVRDCSFDSNWAWPVSGAGITLVEGEGTVARCTFNSNFGSQGGGIAVLRSTATIRDCTFTDNWHAGIYSEQSTTHVLRCSFTGSQQPWNPGSRGIHADSGSINVFRSSFVGIEIDGNGAGILNSGAQLSVENCIFTENAADYGGGVASERMADTTLTNCLFQGNAARGEGGGAYFGGTGTITNCTFVGNDALSGGGLDHSSGVSTFNSVFWGNTATVQSPQIAAYWGSNRPSPRINHSNIQGSGGSSNWDESLGEDGGGNLDADPKFADMAGGNLHLSSGSPCIDAGNNQGVPYVTTDLDGRPRLLDDPDTPDTGLAGWPVVDMGVYEFESESGCGNRHCEPGETCRTCVFDCGDCDGTIHVPGEVASIRAAIEVAADHQEIVVAPGTYHEVIDFFGKAITLRSSGGAEATTIDAFGWDLSAITCTTGETTDTILDGFTITGGTGTRIGDSRYGGGMYIVGASPAVRHCIFTHNTANREGGGLYNRDGSPEVSVCTFRENRVVVEDADEFFWRSGGGMFSDGGRPTINACTFVRNSAPDTGGGFAIWNGSMATVANSLFVGNSADFGGGMYTRDGALTMTNCTLSYNYAGTGSALRNFNCLADVANSILRGSVSYAGHIAATRFTHCNLEGSGGSTNWNSDFGIDLGGNIDTGPLFVLPGDDGGDGWGDDPATRDVDEGANDDYGDLRLQEDSPCIGTGDNEAIAGFKTDLDENARIVGDAVDMGAYEFQPRAIEVRIDVRPGNDVDPLKLGGRGVLPIAILSSVSFDALTVDPGTVVVSVAGVALRGNGRRYVTVERDVNRDGLADLVLHVETAGVQPETGTAKIVLTAQTFDATPIVGWDVVRFVGR